MATKEMGPVDVYDSSSIKVLEGLIEHALKHANVWLGRCDEMVDDMRPGLERIRAEARR